VNDYESFTKMLTSLQSTRSWTGSNIYDIKGTIDGERFILVPFHNILGAESVLKSTTIKGERFILASFYNQIGAGFVLTSATLKE
jgi:hypothetical protein